MKKIKGFYLIQTVIIISILLIFCNLGYFFIRNFNEKKELKTAKIVIYENINNFAHNAFLNSKEYVVEFDYINKYIVFKEKGNIVKKVMLPKSLDYTTIFKEEVLEKKARITKNGNISPPFSIYIFNSKNLAQYRISFYGFQIIKYLKVNVYKNISDPKPKKDKIERFHRNWEKRKYLWRLEN